MAKDAVKQAIVESLRTNDRAIIKALLVLNSRQTADEQAQEETKYHNGCGFRPCHARMGTSMALQFMAKKFLTPKQINYWRIPSRNGEMKIAVYADQLARAAEEKRQATEFKFGENA